MLKKSMKHEGFILLESLLSLTIVCFVISNLFVVSIQLLQQTALRHKYLKMQRYAYEYIKEYELYGGDTYREIRDGRTTYQLSIMVVNQEILKVSIVSGKEAFTVEK